MNLEKLYDPALDALVPEMIEATSKFEFSMDVEWTPERIAQARDLTKLFGGALAGGSEGFEERTIDGPSGPITLRTYVPDDVRAVHLDIHGGGFFMGTPSMDDAANATLARHAKVATVSVDYRLAPEHPYPAAPDDCEAAAVWVLAHAKSEFGSDRVLIGGASAGGGLAATTILRLRDRHDAARAVAGISLEYGVYDLTGTPSSIRSGMVGFRDLYVGDHDLAARQAPDMSPIYADLSGLPPALFTVGTADYLYDDSLFMALRWHAAGNEAELAIYPEAPHGFNVMPSAMGRLANERIRDFLAAPRGGLIRR